MTHALIALTAMALKGGPTGVEAALDDALGEAGLTARTARFDPNLVRLFRTGEFTSNYYAACDENPWRIPFFAQAMRKELSGTTGKPNESLGAVSRTLGFSVRRTLLGNPNASEEESARKPRALRAVFERWRKEGSFEGEVPDFDGVPKEVQQAAALVLSVGERSLSYRKLAFLSLGDLDPVYRAFCESSGDDDQGLAFELKRQWLKSIDLAYLWAGAHDLTLASRTAADWVKAVSPEARYDARIETVWGEVRLTGGSSTEHGENPVLLAIDTGGDDVYVDAPTNRNITNWGSVVIDTSGGDKYVSGGVLENTAVSDFEYRKNSGFAPGPAGALLGYSVLVDLKGNDLYRSHRPGIASGRLGVSVLLDALGFDTYDAYVDSEGFGFFGCGILEDLEGRDKYTGFEQVQGCGQTMGVGMILDRADNDQYIANDERIDFPSPQSAKHNVSMAQGAGNGRRGDYVDGHSFAGGIGILFDAAGNDQYSCGVFGQGVGYWEGVGMLWDTGGNDIYSGQWYVQGAAAHFAVGYLEDTAGDDRYTAPMNMAQGAGHDFSIGWLLDAAGDDTHVAPNLSLGAGNANGIGIFADLAGTDIYECSGITLGKAAEALAGSLRTRALCLGIFVDMEGADTYPAGSVWAKNSSKATNWTGRGPTPEESQFGVFLDR